MRLSEFEKEVIKNSIFKKVKDAKIYLFGSRVYDFKKGGDIDIYVETSEKVSFSNQIDILTDIELSGVERKVDLIFNTPFSKKQPIFQTAKKEGILL